MNETLIFLSELNKIIPRHPQIECFHFISLLKLQHVHNVPQHIHFSNCLDTTSPSNYRMHAKSHNTSIIHTV